jgi:hypothetical protein
MTAHLTWIVTIKRGTILNVWSATLQSPNNKKDQNALSCNKSHLSIACPAKYFRLVIGPTVYFELWSA